MPNNSFTPRFFIFVLIFFMLNSVYAQQFNDYTLSNRLQDVLNNTDQSTHKIVVKLTDQVDIAAMDLNFYEDKVSLQERTETVITALKEKASSTQRALVNWLDQEEGVSEGSLKTFWIANLIALEASTELITKLSHRPDIIWIDIDAKLALESYEEVAAPPPPAPGNSENGLRAIRADKLWEMGYTGYGRLAMSADTGIDPAHPAIVNNWRGNFSSPEFAWLDATNSNNTTPTNCGDHGVHTLGTMVGLDRINDDTIGVAFNAQWVGSNVLCGGGTTSNIAAFQWAIDPDGDPTTTSDMPDAINNSWFDPGVNGECNSAYVNILNAAEAVGIAIVFSAGNDGPNASTITSPKNINTSLVNSFAVGAVNGNNANLTVAGFSSRGPSICGGEGSLEIKPEVSAPGQNVRSCELDGNYGLKSGTSMAAPHVAGAIVLLREAFPTLTGAEIKLALYFTCRDLGVPGEDNTYGMGIIDVLAAFNYLVEQGNEPVEPGVENDIMFVDVVAEERNCDGLLAFDLIFENAGTNNITTADISYDLFDLAGNSVVSTTINWTGDLAPGNRVTLPIALTDAPEGVFDLTASVANPNGQPDSRDYISSGSRSVLVSNQPPLLANYALDVPPCVGASAELIVDAPDATEIRWYFSETAGNPAFTGDRILLPPAGTAFTFFVEATLQEGVGETAPSSSSIFPTGTVNNKGLIFDVHQPIILRSLKVFIDTEGPRLLIIRNGNNSLVRQEVLNGLELGENLVDLDLDLPPGLDYKIFISGNDMAQQPDASYPYSVGSAITIKSSTDLDNPTADYLYFYDIQVEYTQVCGRVPIVAEYQSTTEIQDANFNPSQNPVNLANGGMVSFENLSVNSIEYLWDFGNGNTSTEENPSSTYSTEGTYEVRLISINSEGCGDTKVIELEASELTNVLEEESGMEVLAFPNPAHDLVKLQINAEGVSEVEVQVMDIHGKELQRQEYNFNQNFQTDISLENYPTGVYYIRCLFDNQEIIRKIAKMK